MTLVEGIRTNAVLHLGTLGINEGRLVLYHNSSTDQQISTTVGHEMECGTEQVCRAFSGALRP